MSTPGVSPNLPQDGARRDADRLIELGHAEQAAGNLAAAMGRYVDALSLAPTYPRVFINMGNVCRAMGRLDDALIHFRNVERLAPEYAIAHYNLGALHLHRNEPGLAEYALRRALELDSHMVDGAVMLADILDASGRSAEAEAQLRQVIEPNVPGCIGAVVNLGLMLARQRRVDESRQLLESALAWDADSALLHAALGRLYLMTRRHRDAGRAFARASALDADLPAAVGGTLFLMNFRDDVDDLALFKAHLGVGSRLQAQAQRQGVKRFTRGDAGRRLKIGYVSGDFRQHPVGLFIRPVLACHDPEKFDLFCYSNVETEDDLTRALKRIAPNWRQIASLNDIDAARLMANDGIDILVDLAGYTDGTRLPVFAYRVAPLQISWLGYLNTTGLPTMDYRLTDRHTDPPGATDHLHTETLIRLANSQWCYAPVYSVPRSEPQASRGAEGVIFASFNQFGKISDRCLALWCRVLQALPAATLRVYDVPEGSTRIEFLEQVARHGVEPKRVQLHDRLDLMQYFRAIADADIALDTFPYNGATTSLDVLWMGVALVALRGERGIARGGFSILTTLGLPDLIAPSEDDYVRINVKLALDPDWRRALRGELRNRMEASPLMDTRRFVRDLEDHYLTMWQALGRDDAV